jgi:hypothetical protein
MNVVFIEPVFSADEREFDPMIACDLAQASDGGLERCRCAQEGRAERSDGGGGKAERLPRWRQLGHGLRSLDCRR